LRDLIVPAIARDAVMARVNTIQSWPEITEYAVGAAHHAESAW
jgi:hypothetical protein